MNSLLSCHVQVSFVGESGHIVHNIKLADFGVQGTPLRPNISHFHAIFGKIDQLQGLALLVRLRLLGSLVMLYWFHLNHLCSKFNWCINKSKVKCPSLNTCQVSSVRKVWDCNTRCATRWVLGSQIQSPLEVTFFSEFILLFPCKPLLPTLPQSSILGKTRLCKRCHGNNLVFTLSVYICIKHQEWDLNPFSAPVFASQLMQC